MRSFSYTPAPFSKVFFLHTSCYLYWGVSLTLLVRFCLFVRSFSYTPHASFCEESFTLRMVVPVRCFSYTPHPLRLMDRGEFPLSYSLCGGFKQNICFSYTIIGTRTYMRPQMLCLDQTKMQEQGLTGYSSVRLTSRASHRLGKCRLSWVWLGFWLLLALS